MIVLSRTRRIDWGRVVLNLQSRGMSLQQVADDVGVSKATVGGWTSDIASEPAFWTGTVLIELWCAKTGLKWPELPVHSVPDTRFSAVRSCIQHSDEVQQALLQLGMAWGEAGPPLAQVRETAPSVRYRVGLAVVQGSLQAFVAHDAALAAAAERSPEFVRWDGPWAQASISVAEAASA